ncbi:MAG: tRNA (guanine(10)-N(2))-dimethyltransferase [Candidatus Bathyarchaeia archaeon]
MAKSGFETDFPSEIVREGKVVVLVPRLSAFAVRPSDYAPSKAPVFYNPVMELNRDIAVLAAQVYQHRINREVVLCEPLAGSGIRGVRFAVEVHGVKKVLINDINEAAFKLASYNVKLNAASSRITVEHKDANCLLSAHGAPQKRFDIIDVDPFGSPVPYLDSAIRALRDGGLLAVTATDMAPLCGVHEKACIRKYGGKPLRTEYCQELAIRLLTGCVATLAAKHDMGINVLFSHQNNHYIRLYAEISYGARKADTSIENLGYILHCFNCLHRENTKTLFSKNIEQCPECGARMDYAGPLWISKIFDKEFCELMLRENEHRSFRNNVEITKLLTTAIDEAEAPSTYYVVDKFSSKLGLPAPSPATVLQALRANNFQAVRTHFNSRGLRTNASALVMHNLLKSLVNKR